MGAATTGDGEGTGEEKELDWHPPHVRSPSINFSAVVAHGRITCMKCKDAAYCWAYRRSVVSLSVYVLVGHNHELC